jgi:methyl-accepting chemotaxis protein
MGSIFIKTIWDKESDFIKSNRKKVNKILTNILWIIFAGAIILYTMGQVQGAIVGSLFIELSIATILILRTKKHILIMSVLFMAILTCTVSSIGGPNTGMIIASVLCLVSLYLNKTILFSFGGIYTLTFTIINFQGNNYDDIGFYLANMGFLGLISLVLYFVCKRSADLIEMSNSNEEQAKNNETEAQNMVRVIGENTVQLHGNIDNCNRDIHVLRKISDIMSTKIREVAEDIEHQSSSIAHINTMMNSADTEMAEINLMSTKLAKTSKYASQTLAQSAEQFSQMDEQMKIINLAVQESFSTVGALNKSIEQVNGFLAAISQIASETNLLALNARIEAARAGEAGAGFSVVALQIKKLAEQSAGTVEDINDIVQDIKTKTNAVLKKATDEEEAVKKGDVITKQVIDSFEKVSSAFKTIDHYIENEIDKIDHVSGVFSYIRDQSMNISAIAHNNLVTTKELLDANKEQDNSIEIISTSIDKISHSSVQLQELIKTSGSVSL